jgi:hypothetical protein
MTGGHHHRLRGRAMKLLLPRCVAAVAICGPTAPAQADTYCVLPDASCPADHAFPSTTAGLQAALTAAKTHAGADRVQIGAGHFQQPDGSPFVYGYSSDPVTIVGAGADRTVLEGPADAVTPLLLVSADSAARSAVSGLGLHLRVHQAGALPQGIVAFRNTDIADVAIDAEPDAGATGVVLQRGSTFAHGSVTLAAGVGISVGPGIGTVSDASVTAAEAVHADSGSAAYVQRCSLRAIHGWGLFTQGGAVSAFDTTIRLDGTSTAVQAKTPTAGPRIPGS